MKKGGKLYSSAQNISSKFGGINGGKVDFMGALWKESDALGTRKPKSHTRRATELKRTFNVKPSILELLFLEEEY